MSRREMLAAVTGVAAGAVAGCGRQAPVRIAVVWSSDELRSFQSLLRGNRQNATVYSAGDNIATVLRGPSTRVLPDVAVIPRLGLLRDDIIADRLKPVGSADPAFWRELATARDGQVVGSWFKSSHKSLVWHRGTASQPADWDDWTAELHERAAHGPPLAIGAADGWMLTDWFENHLLGHAPQVYARLADDPAAWADDAVRQSLDALAELWRTPGLFPGGGRTALTQQFHDALLDVFRYRRADMVVAPDFAWPVIAKYGTDAANAGLFRFPGAGRTRPLVVGGDLAVALTDPGAVFVTWLAGADVRDQLEGWARQGGFLAPYLDASLAPRLLRGPARELRALDGAAYDLSDRLTGGLAGGDGRGLWRILTRLFTAVAVEDVPTREAVAEAVRDLRANSGGTGGR
ncbi:MAG: hypothetical protein HOY71_13375 [Nonomuraea sp.]|nr:hypothetical protein [Nonomuraea sp.]